MRIATQNRETGDQLPSRHNKPPILWQQLSRYKPKAIPELQGSPRCGCRTGETWRSRLWKRLQGWS